MASPKRLIESELPIAKISAHARRDQNVRKGHLHSLHVWWATRPLAACRAVLLASLLPDPNEADCPPTFRRACQKYLAEFAEAVRTKKDLRDLLKNNEATKWVRRNETVLKPGNPACWAEMRQALLDFIADSAAWEMSARPEMLKCAWGLVAAAHEALGGEPGTKPLVVDPFAGGGAIPLEALRLGCDAFAMDYNPVAALLLKVVLEYIPRYGERLADAIREWGGWVKERAEKELGKFYPKDPDGSVPSPTSGPGRSVARGPAAGPKYLSSASSGSPGRGSGPSPSRCSPGPGSSAWISRLPRA